MSFLLPTLHCFYLFVVNLLIIFLLLLIFSSALDSSDVTASSSAPSLILLLLFVPSFVLLSLSLSFSVTLPVLWLLLVMIHLVTCVLCIFCSASLFQLTLDEASLCAAWLSSVLSVIMFSCFCLFVHRLSKLFWKCCINKVYDYRPGLLTHRWAVTEKISSPVGRNGLFIHILVIICLDSTEDTDDQTVWWCSWNYCRQTLLRYF